VRIQAVFVVASVAAIADAGLPGLTAPLPLGVLRYGQPDGVGSLFPLVTPESGRGKSRGAAAVARSADAWVSAPLSERILGQVLGMAALLAALGSAAAGGAIRRLRAAVAIWPARVPPPSGGAGRSGPGHPGGLANAWMAARTMTLSLSRPLPRALGHRSPGARR
jgi:hypothetical protein